MVNHKCWPDALHLKARLDFFINEKLSPKAIEGPPLPLESVHHVHGSDCFPLGVLGVGDSVPNDVLQEHLQHAPSQPESHQLGLQNVLDGRKSGPKDRTRDTWVR